MLNVVSLWNTHSARGGSGKVGTMLEGVASGVEDMSAGSIAETMSLALEAVAFEETLSAVHCADMAYTLLDEPLLGRKASACASMRRR